MAVELNVRGLMNVQYAIFDNTVYVLEANPRASRTVPIVSKVCSISMARLVHYAVVLIGFLVTLSVLGFDFTNIAIIEYTEIHHVAERTRDIDSRTIDNTSGLS